MIEAHKNANLQNFHSWQNDRYFTLFPRSIIKWNSSAMLVVVADFLCAKILIWHLIPATAIGFWPLKNDLIDGFIFSRFISIPCSFSIFNKIFKFDLSRASTLWLLHSKWFGTYVKISKIGCSIFRFLLAESIIKKVVLCQRSLALILIETASLVPNASCSYVAQYVLSFFICYVNIGRKLSRRLPEKISSGVTYSPSIVLLKVLL